MPRTAELQRAAGLYKAGRLDEARTLALEILAAQPKHVHALHLLTAIAVRTGRPEECIEHASKALALEPHHVEVLCNRGIALRALDRVEAALEDYERVLALQPKFVPAFNLKGVALAALNRHEEAIASYSAALALDPGFAPAHFNRGLSHLVRGDFEPGWCDHEWRWRGSDTQIALRNFGRPQWQGEDLQGKTILVHAEQGLGDTIQFSRYVPLLAACRAEVVLEVQPSLTRLLAQLPGAHTVIAMNETRPAIDYHCPILSLPFAFGTRLDSIPASIPYLSAPAAHIERWRSRLGPRRGLRVGLAWSGNAAQANDRNRSIAFERLMPLGDPAWTLVSLQKDIRERDRAALDGCGTMLRFEDEIEDFRDTAAIIAELDLVVSADTSVAHLAAAMGKPVWVLLAFSADWRWLLDRDDSPWYPTARLFRQSQRGDWSNVLENVSRELRALASDQGRAPESR